MAFYSSGPNEALVVSGLCLSRPRLIPGGRVFVWPFIQKIQRISLNLMTLTVESPKIYTAMGVPISVQGMAQVKIESTKEEMLAHACQQFLGKTEQQVKSVIMETLEGHQRAIMGTMTVEEIYQDRQKFSTAVFEVASRDLINMGVTIVSYTLQSISDEVGYLSALGKAQTAQVQRDARIGQAEARRDAGISEALAMQAKEAARYKNQTAIAESERDYNLKQAEYDIQVKTQQATANLAKDLQAAKVHQKIRHEEVGVKIIERQKQINLMEQEIVRRERELEAQVRKPAIAEKYRQETLAEAEKNRMILEAEAKAEAIRARGEANAYSIQAKAQAEAEAMQKQAEAFEKYGSAAMLDMVLKTMPRVAAEIAAPLASVDKITMVAGPDGEIGASKITGEVLNIMNKLPDTIKGMTGLDMGDIIKVSQV
ncbi:flotillin 1 [Salpingoeca rosetta]|uniref:Flotillin 1 n=1 Tax=Salpingoeca rosetta (strain ATCC 50818 / BSB-021) TaxID=946362 RepID=F2UCR5_SALR5|nr:flotillin 1 [Salpingoeca rosetta]EGD74372.1 flotillin 1 [Salpingoeca rosetta]|eukprot:XP_004993272.1 flotillin 1 [Salpingoeca rosetta]